MLTYSELREIEKKELEGGSLIEVSKDFYLQVSNLLNEKREAAKNGSVMAIREYSNIKKVVSIIQSKREEKLLLMVLRTEKSAIGSTTEEQDVFLKIQQIIKTYRESLFLERDKKLTIQKILIRENVESYKGGDGRIYGPFKRGDIISIPNIEQEWLLKENMAERMKY